MCGICGFTGTGQDTILTEMMAALRHRGPDENGVYFDEHISLGHQRLSIIDLSTGRQPIFNEDKTICLVFNGEIYNYQELKKELIAKGHKFYTSTDTEVAVHLYEEMGEDFVKVIDGEFAYALWDKNNSRLLLIRDRLGIRPLYYYLAENQIIFASEPKAILKHPKVKKKLNSCALYSYLRLRYVAGQETMFGGIEKVPAAATLIYQNGSVKIEKYWDLRFKIDNNLSAAKAQEQFQDLLSEAVKLRLMSDVPLGLFISGGVDSAVILALARKFISGEIKTFSVGFNTDIDEVSQARKLAALFSTKHREFYTAKDSYKLFPEIVGCFDEPLGDAIILPTYLLAKEAAESVKVALTGEGADEILGGYIHQTTMHHSQALKNFPSGALKILQAMIGIIPHAIISGFFPYPASLGKSGKNRIIEYLANVKNTAQAYFNLAELFSPPQIKGLLSEEFYRDCQTDCLSQDFLSLLEDQPEPLLNKVVNLDLKRWLPDYTLMKQDRLAMANSLETRVPYLGHRLVEFCATLPVSLKISNRQTKSILRKSAINLLPKEFAYAKKRAFYFPTEKCFDENFGSFVKAVLLDNNSAVSRIFNRGSLEGFLKSYRKNELADNKKLLALVILNLWLKHYY